MVTSEIPLGTRNDFLCSHEPDGHVDNLAVFEERQIRDALYSVLNRDVLGFVDVYF